MGLHVVYGNRAEALVEAFADDVDALRAAAGPLAPVPLLVPNRHIHGYVERAVARARGIAANFRARRLEGFAAELVAAHRGELRLVDGRVLQGAVLSLLLDDEFLRGLWAAPLRNYVFAVGDGDGPADLRRAQLSRKLARVFEEYVYSRPELLDAWERGRTLLQDTAQAEVEAWQSNLWRAVAGLLEGRGRASGERWLDLRRFLAETHAADAALPARVFAFGFSYVAPLFHRMLAWVAERAEVHVYAVNPCREFWEDAGAGEPADGDDPLLRLWGRPGREHLALLNQAAGYAFEERFVEPAPTTLLGAIQADVLARAMPAAPAAPAAADPRRDDPHIKVMACPSVAREAEVIADEIWRLLRADETLLLSDIAVVVAGPDDGAYLAHLCAAFRDAHDLPLFVPDAPLGGASRIVEGVRLLLGLPLGEFGRQDLLALITHPAVLGRFPDVDPQTWLTLCDELGIVHGADRADHERTYIERDVFHWDQGLRRLALGAFATGVRSGDERTVDVGGQPYLPEERGATDLDGGARLALLARSLIADARFARGARMTLGEWAAFLGAYASAYLRPADEREQRDLLRCLDRLHAIDELELGDVAVSYRVAHELAWRGVAELRGPRGEGLADGVVVSPLQPMRAQPFRVVFVAGLGEGKFPAAAARNQLDLRQAQRRPGDVNPRERDKYAFLELVLSARERLVLSYVARNPLTGEALQPSSVVQELLHVVEQGYLGECTRAVLCEQRALRRFDDERLEAAVPARRERTARALGRDARATLGQPLDRGALRAAMPPASWQALAELLGIAEPPEPPARELGAVEVPLSALRRFLECPLQGSARYLLRLADDEDVDVLAREDEPFALSRLDDIVLLREVFVEALRRGAPPAAVYAERAGLRELAGRLPTGVFGRVLADGHARDLACWKAWWDSLPVGAGALEAVRFGRAEQHARVGRIEPPIALDVDVVGRRVRVSVTGRTGELVPGGGGTAILAKRSPNYSRTHVEARDARDWMKAFVDQAALAAAGLREGQPHVAYHCVTWLGETRPNVVRFAAMSRDEGRAYLRAVAGDLLSGVHPYLLPFEAAYRIGVAKPDDAVADSVAAAIEDTAVTSHGPVPDLERFAPPPDGEARAIVARRYGPMFERMEVVE